MEEKLILAKQILKKYNQDHLLYFYDELSANEKDILLNQILRIDFNKILTLYKNYLNPATLDISTISPLYHFEKDSLSKELINDYIKVGEEIIRSGSFAVVTMAGGQGTRLGYNGPKGTYELTFESSNTKKSLFQIMCEDIKRANQKYQTEIPWYIMTSVDNDSETRAFFEENNFWEYPKEKISFFMQENLPLVDINGKLILQEPYLIKEVSNGNGNVFHSMAKCHIIDELEKNHIRWISFAGIDNILIKNVDPFFVGLACSKNYEIASKSVFKKDPLENTSVFCKKSNKPAILYYKDIDLELSNSKFDNGMYKYREMNMLSHLMTLDAVKKVSNLEFPYHLALKKNCFINKEAMKEVPNEPNTYKFEHFIFDVFSAFDDMLLVRVNPNEEFAPIKSFTSIYNPDTAKEKYEKYWNVH